MSKGYDGASNSNSRYQLDTDNPSDENDARVKMSTKINRGDLNDDMKIRGTKTYYGYKDGKVIDF